MAKDKNKNNDFAKPSDAPATGEGWNLTEEAEGKLLLFTPLRKEEVETKEFGAKEVIIADVVVINEDKPAKSEEHEEVYVWGGYLKGALRGFIGERKVLGRLVRGKEKMRGNFPWLLEDASDGDIDNARAYLDSIDPFGQKGAKSTDDDEPDEKPAKKKKAKK